MPSNRKLAAKVGANSRWSKEDPTRQGKILRAGLDAKFLREVDPNNELPEAERQRRAECARKAFFQRLALKSAAARKARRATPDRGSAA
jgi:hypothetical protein